MKNFFIHCSTMRSAILSPCWPAPATRSRPTWWRATTGITKLRHHPRLQTGQSCRSSLRDRRRPRRDRTPPHLTTNRSLRPHPSITKSGLHFPPVENSNNRTVHEHRSDLTRRVPRLPLLPHLRRTNSLLRIQRLQVQHLQRHLHTQLRRRDFSIIHQWRHPWACHQCPTRPEFVLTPCVVIPRVQQLLPGMLISWTFLPALEWIPTFTLQSQPLQC